MRKSFTILLGLVYSLNSLGMYSPSQMGRVIEKVGNQYTTEHHVTLLTEAGPQTVRTTYTENLQTYTSSIERWGGEERRVEPLPASAPMPVIFFPTTRTEPAVHVHAPSVESLLPGIQSANAVRASSQLLLEACRAKVGELTSTHDGVSELQSFVREKVDSNFFGFDGELAVQLQLTLSSLDSLPRAELAELFCEFDQLNKAIEIYNDIQTCEGRKCDLKGIANESLRVSIDELARAGDSLQLQDGEYANHLALEATTRDLAMTLLEAVVDVGSAFLPGVSTARDIYEATTGKDALSGRDLSRAERILAVVSAASLGTSGLAKVGVKAVGKIAQGIKRAHSIEVSAVGIESAVFRAERVVESAEKNLNWGHWRDLQKISLDGREYAVSNNRFFTQHAVDHMAPRGLGSAAGPVPVLGRGVPPSIVEDTIKNGKLVDETVVARGVNRQTWLRDGVQVVTENAGRVVVTVMRVGAQ